MIKSTRIETNIKDKESDKFLTYKIDLDTGMTTMQYGPGEDIAIDHDWRRRIEDGTIISGSIMFLSMTSTHNSCRDVWIESHNNIS